jgi:hypothetical protein
MAIFLNGIRFNAHSADVAAVTEASYSQDDFKPTNCSVDWLGKTF